MAGAEHNQRDEAQEADNAGVSREESALTVQDPDVCFCARGVAEEEGASVAVTSIAVGPQSHHLQC